MIRERRQSLFYGIYRLLTATTWLKSTRYTWLAIKTSLPVFLFFFWTFHLICSCLNLSYLSLTIKSIEMVVIVDTREKLAPCFQKKKNSKSYQVYFTEALYWYYDFRKKISYHDISSQKNSTVTARVIFLSFYLLKIMKFYAILLSISRKHSIYWIAITFFLCKIVNFT